MWHKTKWQFSNFVLESGKDTSPPLHHPFPWNPVKTSNASQPGKFKVKSGKFKVKSGKQSLQAEVVPLRPDYESPIKHTEEFV